MKHSFTLLVSLIGLFSQSALGQGNPGKAAPKTGSAAQALPKASNRRPAGITQAQLQGKWQAVDDEREFWIIQGTSLTMRYVTSGTSADDDRLRLHITDTCATTCASLDTQQVARGEYLAVVDMACNAPRCYTVLGYSPNSLTLSYTARGNTLRLRRVKQSISAVVGTRLKPTGAR
ncbi:hypothetical protein [Hymenobacter metallicola]|uniref:TIGR03067 domain-containing protein n=1 Tax=Hymenobacter metallicola TaxID=2563114 RepID=A0A4Z0QEF7_9BACT|nr:hypothetical protein [Hymenobacter metallicola]TGE28125.1 hypothetical protein E5K02_01275 [Hymenobacter metallicola]